MLNFEINSDKNNSDTNISTVTISGEIDIHTVANLNKTLETILAEKPTVVVADLSEVSYIDSTGLGAFARSAEKLSTNNGVFYVLTPSLQIKKIFTVSGLTKLHIKLIETLEEIES